MKPSDKLTHDFTGAILALIVALQQDHFNGKARADGKRDDIKSVPYILEEALVRGLKALRRWKETDLSKRMNAGFADALRQHPEYALDPVKLQALMTKYGIGASKAAPATPDEVEMDEEELDAATAPETPQSKTA